MQTTAVPSPNITLPTAVGQHTVFRLRIWVSSMYITNSRQKCSRKIPMLELYSLTHGRQEQTLPVAEGDKVMVVGDGPRD